MNNDRFVELLNLYLDNRATDSERDELMHLIRHGSHDRAILERIDASLSGDPDQEAMDPRHSERILRKILDDDRRERKVVPMRSTSRSWQWVAAAAVLMIALSVGWWIAGVEQRPPQLTILHDGQMPSVVHSGKQFVRLPDGSTVVLNANTRLSYPTSFGARVREVTLVGEGYFDVQHDPSRPFRVLTGSVTTTVLGTAFNIKAYAGEEEIEVSVTRGKVNVEDAQGNSGIITHDQQISVNTATNEFIQKDLRAETAVAWQSKYLIFDDVSLEDAVKTIGEKYHVRITLGNERLKACRIRATFMHGEGLDQVLTVVCGVVHSRYTRRPDGSVLIEGEGCK